MSYLQTYYHIIFSTKQRIATLPERHHKKLYNYIWSVIKNKKCHLYRIGGTEDHIHILTSLHPTICLSDFIRDLKTSTSKWMKNNKDFPNFMGWQAEYAALTKSHADHDVVIEYIKGQKEHHKKESALDEFKRLLIAEGIKIDEMYFK